MSTQAGESLRVLITVSEDVSRDKWLCHRYVELKVVVVEMILANNIAWDSRAYNAQQGFQLSRADEDIDWFRFQQEDPPHDAFRPQGFPRQQHIRCRASPYAQQDLRRRVGLNDFRTNSNLALTNY